jgi:hypothetical protein
MMRESSMASASTKSTSVVAASTPTRVVVPDDTALASVSGVVAVLLVVLLSLEACASWALRWR